MAESSTMSPANTTLPVVNSYDEWSPLEEVIVGDPAHLAYDDDVSFRLFFHDNVGGSPVHTGTWAPSPDAPDEHRLRAEMAEDLAGFVDLLTTHGVPDH
jgi:glycine amidinotransferase